MGIRANPAAASKPGVHDAASRPERSSEAGDDGLLIDAARARGTQAAAALRGRLAAAGCETEVLEGADALIEVATAPQVTTLMAAIVGAVPIAIGWGAGAEARQPLGVAVVGGLIISRHARRSSVPLTRATPIVHRASPTPTLWTNSTPRV